jgi:cytochrome P450
MDQDSMPVGVALTTLDADYREDPHAKLDKIRAQCPVQWDHVAGSHRLLRYMDARKIISDRSLGRDPDKAEPRAVFFKNQRRSPEGLTHPDDSRASILLLDNPDHARVREPIVAAFNKRAAAMEPTIRRIVAETLMKLPLAGEFDLISAFAIPIPILVIAAILGIESEMLNDFRRWSVAIADGFNPARGPEATKRMVEGHNAATAYFDAAIQARRRDPQDDLISDLVAHQAKHQALSDAEIRYNCLLLLAAGNSTTTDLIGMAVYFILSTPAAAAAIKADPAKIKGAVEETLRIVPSIENTARVASHDLDIEGHSIKQGEVVLVSLIGANHDPAVFANPHSFDISRQKPSHISFGGGAHFCLGAALARMETNIALTALFDRIPKLRLADPTPRWRISPTFRGLDRLDVAVD